MNRLGIRLRGTLLAVVVALASANSGIASLFDALNVVYNEREKRSYAHFYITTFLFTLAGIGFVIVAIVAVVVFPLILDTLGRHCAYSK